MRISYFACSCIAATVMLLGMRIAAHAASGAASGATAAGSNVPAAQAPLPLRLVGDDGMSPLILQLNQLFLKNHPGEPVQISLRGAATAMPALAAGVSDLSPLAREAWTSERAAFKQMYGYEPQTIRIGYAGQGPRAATAMPAAVYVNAGNALAGLTHDQVMQIFTSGVPAGDLNLWSQLDVPGVPEVCKPRRIHLYGGRDDGGAVTSLRQRKLGGHPFAASYEALAQSDQVLQAVADDICGIAILPHADAMKWAAKVRVLPLSNGDTRYHGTSYDEVERGEYPLEPGLQLYFNHAAGTSLSPVLRAYLESALSDEGQALIALQKSGPGGYVPLSPRDLQREREKLRHL